MLGGVYIIESTDGRRYVGSSVNIEKRMKEHRGSLVRGDHHSRFLQRAWNKHGASAFRFRPLLYCAPEHLLMFEQRCIDGYKPEYNTSQVAGSVLGIKRSDETRAKMAQSWKQTGLTPSRLRHIEHLADSVRGKPGRRHDDSVKRKISASLRGRSADPAANQKRSAAQLGRAKSTEHRAKLAEAARRRWANTPEEVRRANVVAARAAFLANRGSK